MNDLLIGYGFTLAAICIIMALFLFYRVVLSNKLLQQSKKLQLLMNKIPKEVLENASNPTELVSSGLSNIGISGILSELGIDSKILSNPLVKGLIDKYAPKVLEQLSKQGENKNNEGFI